MFLDILGVLVGFISVMFLLSLLVTALVQATLAVFRVRGRNLKSGLAALLQQGGVRGDLDQAKTLAHNVLERQRGNTAGASALDQTIGPACTEISFEDFRDGLTSATKNDPKPLVADIELKKRFEAVELDISRRFRTITRAITVAWAILVAFYFQLSSPELLARLSTDEAVREHYVNVAAKLLEDDELTPVSTDENVASEALALLAGRHPSVALQLEEASGVGDRATQLHELSLILSDHPQQAEAIVDDYTAILDDLQSQRAAAAMAQAADAGRYLARLDITPWSQGPDYYLSAADVRFDRIFGVLITAVFLSLGAPFWYERLRVVLRLRDAFAGRRDRTTPSQGAPPPPG